MAFEAHVVPLVPARLPAVAERLIGDNGVKERLLRRVLTDQILIRITQCVDVGGEVVQPFGDLLDDRAELGVSIGVLPAELGRGQIDLGEQPLKGALEGLVLDVLEARLQGVQQLGVLRASQVGDATPQVIRRRRFTTARPSPNSTELRVLPLPVVCQM